MRQFPHHISTSPTLTPFLALSGRWWGGVIRRIGEVRWKFRWKYRWKFRLRSTRVRQFYGV